MKVKVCGFTSRDDVMRAVDMGVDAVGFVFVPSSPRCADPAEVERAVADLPPFVTAVGVFQDQDARLVRHMTEVCGLGLVQLHGSENTDYIRSLLPHPVLKAVCVSERRDLDRLASYAPLSTFLLDGPAHGSGGGGCAARRRVFDWAWAVEARKYGRVVLAGGLDPDNVTEAVSEARPWAVDAASGTEARPGVKDPQRMRLFIKRAKEGGSA